MKLADFLSPSRTLTPLACATLSDAREQLLDLLVASGAVADLERLRNRVTEERGEDMVAFADHAFLMHYRTDTAQRLQVAIGVSPTGVTRGLDDGGEQRAPIVVVIVGPPRTAARLLQIVRAFGRLLPKPEVVQALCDAPTVEALVSLSMFHEFEIADQLLVRDLMTDRPRTIGPDELLKRAARELIHSKLGGLPVVDGDHRLLGILSERELMRHLLVTEVFSDGAQRHPTAQSNAKTVRDAMTRQVLCVAPDQPIAQVAALMSNKDVERVPVVREGRLVGLLTRGDIVRKLIGP
ncbi:MAG TPA: CBS domain-containing protein [Gemmatimonadaceae bacterium]|jgi:CBS domain-containing protein/mannitol/fructose-specific phosphotransferase system IIA component (Ntr-type)